MPRQEAPAAVAAGGASIAGKVLYRVGRAVAWVLLHALARPSVESALGVPARGPLLVVANHTSYLDPVLLAVAIPRPLAFLAKEELFHPTPWGWALRAAGIIPVRRGRVDRQALDAAVGVLRAGGALAVFAEGTRSPDGCLQAAEPGVGLLAVRSGAPVLPVALLGTQRLRSLAGWAGPPRLVARCGVVWQPTASERGGSATYRRMADQMMAGVAALLPEARRGQYQGVPVAAPRVGADQCPH